MRNQRIKSIAHRPRRPHTSQFGISNVPKTFPGTVLSLECVLDHGWRCFFWSRQIAILLRLLVYIYIYGNQCLLRNDILVKIYEGKVRGEWILEFRSPNINGWRDTLLVAYLKLFDGSPGGLCHHDPLILRYTSLEGCVIANKFHPANMNRNNQISGL